MTERGTAESPRSAGRTTPPERAVLLYDGDCGFCVAASARVVRMAPAGAVLRVSFRTPGALDAFPGVSAAACEDALHLVEADGRVTAGAEAVSRVVGLRPLLRPFARLYYLPGLRWAADAAYRWIARRRYRWFARGTCDGACRIDG